MMLIADQLRIIQQVLAPWAAQNNGQAFVCSDPSILWSMAFAASSKLRVLIAYMGEDARSEFAIAAATHRVDRQFVVLITRGRGFSYPRGDTLVETVGNNVPLFQLLEEGRDLIRSILNASVELPVDFKAIKSHAMGEVIMDAYSIEFSLASDLPAIVAQPDNTVAIPP